jgi:hypothetical protein
MFRIRYTDSDPDPYHWITDLGPDEGKIPKTYFGFYGSGTPVEIKFFLICLLVDEKIQDPYK